MSVMLDDNWAVALGKEMSLLVLCLILLDFFQKEMKASKPEREYIWTDK